MNNWANPSRASAQEVAEMASSLVERAQSPDQKNVNAALVDVLSPNSGQQLLEVGCGVGSLCRLVAPGVAPNGKITGVDISADFVSFAQEQIIHTDFSSYIQWGVCQAEFLPFIDARFDGVLAARLLLHVLNPKHVLSELKRVVRPGGRVVVMDWDFETVTIDHSDRNLTRRVLHWRCDHHGGNNWSGRKLWKLMKTTGLVNVQIFPYVSFATNENDSLTRSIFRAAQVARDASVINQKEYTNWVEELKSCIADDCFSASIVYFIVAGEREFPPVQE